MFQLLKKRKEGAASGDIESVEREPDEGAEPFDAIGAIAQDLHDAMEKKDVNLIKEALTAFAEHLQSIDEEQDEQSMKGPA